MTSAQREMQHHEKEEVFSLEIGGENPAHQEPEKMLTLTMVEKWLKI